MTEEELKELSGNACGFTNSLCVVPLKHALAAIKTEREECARLVYHILKGGVGTYGGTMHKRSNVDL